MVKPQLVYKSDGQEVKVGDKIKDKDHAGVWEVTYYRYPSSPASEGKVSVNTPNGGIREYYVSVIGAHWINRTDR